ncbi:MAG: hypothetical protein ACI39E_03280 [Acutalibacteraceae bacterium]
MKKVWMIGLTAALVLAMGTTSVLAAGAGRGKQGAENGSCGYAQSGACYTDEDGDGICDNRDAQTGVGAGNGKQGAGNGNQSGICLRDGTGAGNGASYKDEDGDGICDNRDAQTGANAAYGKQGAGNGTSYKDEDGDGICDNRDAQTGAGCGARPQDGTGCQNGTGKGRGSR